MIAWVDGKARTFKLVNGARVWDDPVGMYRHTTDENDGRCNGRGMPLPWEPQKSSTRHEGATR